MKKYLFFLLLLSPIFAICSNVNGNAFLDNDSNHSGITIKFLPVSSSSEYTEGSKDSNEIIYVSGNVSGNWISSNTYIVTGDITVPEGEVLNIEPNTEIKFDGYYSLIVNGTLNAIGTEENYIKFTSNNTSPSNSDWNQILFNSSSSFSALKYCIVEYGKLDNDQNYGIIHVSGSGPLDIENCIIQNSDESAISILNTTGAVNIKNNQIQNCSYGIFVNTSVTTVIENNKISNISLIGMSIHLESNGAIVYNNQVSNCGVYGIQSWANIPIMRNIIFNVNQYGIMIPGGQALLWNNTIFSNGSGIGIYNNDFFNPNPNIDSNIFYDNVNYGIRSEGEPMPSIVTHNLFYNNGSGVGNNLPVGVGTIVTENNNGTGSDTYYNIFVEPNLVSTDPNDSDFCELLESSEAINAGNPNIDNPFNSSIIDIGAREFDGNLSVNEFSNNNKIIVYPNPINDFVSIISSNKEFNKASIYDINGKLIKNINQSSLGFEMTLQISDFLKTGFYFLKIFEDDTLISTLKILKN